jgi:Xaa-Pro aminopeptidase
VAAILLYGDTVRYPAIRHEVPLEILDPLLFVARDGDAFVMTSSLDSARVARVLPDADVLTADELGFHELVEEGMAGEEAEHETAVRALQRWGVEDAVVPPDLPVALADRLRAEGIAVEIDARAVSARRRVKTSAELAGILRAQRAAEAGLAAAEELIRSAERSDGRLHRDGEPLTAEQVRGAIRAACAAAGAPAPVDIIVGSALSGGGHDPGAGPLPADLPIVVDVWPRDEESGCWADMARTFVAGEVTSEVAALRDVVREALEAARSAARPGITGRALYEVAAEIIERAGARPSGPAPRRDPDPGLLLQPRSRRWARGPRGAAARARRRRAARGGGRGRDRARDRGTRGHRKRHLRGPGSHHRGRQRDDHGLPVRPVASRSLSISARAWSCRVATFPSM